jgi:hypothetical protein
MTEMAIATSQGSPDESPRAIAHTIPGTPLSIVPKIDDGNSELTHGASRHTCTVLGTALWHASKMAGL